MEIRGNRYSFFLLFFVLFAVYCFIFGDSGILERRRLDDDKKILDQRIDNLKDENAGLDDLYQRYKKGEFKKEEAVKAGYIEKGEKLVFFKNEEKERQGPKEKTVKDDGFDVDLSHLRILWVVISVMILLIYYVVRSKYKEE